MRIVDTSALNPASLDRAESLYIYNGPKEIPLTRGYSAYVDAEDYPRLIQHRWFANVGNQVRAIRHLGRRLIYMHHDVLQCIDNLEGKEIDHIDRNPLNNCKSNLRIVTHTENMLNTARHVERRGYCYNKRAKLWCVYLDRPNHKRLYLGYTKTEEEAVKKAEEAKNAYL